MIYIPPQSNSELPSPSSFSVSAELALFPARWNLSGATRAGASLPSQCGLPSTAADAIMVASLSTNGVQVWHMGAGIEPPTCPVSQ